LGGYFIVNGLEKVIRLLQVDEVAVLTAQAVHNRAHL
jgi:DNA-directed RNA polymerase beta subunit